MGGDFLAAVDENERKERLRNAFVSLLLPRTLDCDVGIFCDVAEWPASGLAAL
jgi:hypothetical protein